MKSKSLRSKTNNILVVGKIPPPKGGVGVHVERLISKLKVSDYTFIFFDMRTSSLNLLPKYILKSKLVHLHTSNSYLRLLIIIFCQIINTKIIFTFHGNLGRYNKLRNFIDNISISISNHSVLINQASYNKAKNISKKISHISAFFEPNLSKIEKLDFKIQARIKKMESNNKFMFCTNANAINYDINHEEIYGIFKLVEIFKNIPELGLIISDASGEYKRYFQENNVVLPVNIYLISIVHDFLSIIENCHCFIRATTTDGDSLSVKEALFLKKSVIASDCIDRPEGCILYQMNNSDDLKNKIINFKMENKTHNINCGITPLFMVYKKLLNGE